MKMHDMLSRFGRNPQEFSDFLNDPIPFTDDPDLTLNEKHTLRVVADTSKRLAMFTPSTLPQLAEQLTDLQALLGSNGRVATFKDYYTDNFSDSYTNSDGYAGVAKWAEKLVLQSGLDPLSVPELLPVVTPAQPSTSIDETEE